VPPFLHEPGYTIRGEELDLFLFHCFPGTPEKGFVPEYQFEITHRGQRQVMGHINLRIETTARILHYVGHIGYGIHDRFRGNRYAGKACLLLQDLIREHGINPVCITCNPENEASRRTIQALGTTYINTVDIDEHDPIYMSGERQKERYYWTV
jgi:predicted acetyltransferase